MTQVRTLRDRRLAVLLALTLGLVGTGIASLAVLTDSLNVTNEYTALAVDLQADGEDALTFNILIGDSDHFQAVELSNAGNAELRYSMLAAATGAAPILNDFWSVYAVLDTECNAAEVDEGAIVSANRITQSGATVANAFFGSPTAGEQTGDRVLAAGASEWLCMRTTPSAPLAGNGDTATQTVTFSAESTAGNG